MKILLIGSGGREHALAWKLSQSPQCEKLFCVPGNPGTSQHGMNVPLDPLDFTIIGKFCLDNEIAMIVVGPEEPLVKGMRDHFEADDRLKAIRFIGPGESGARIEGSKDFSKELMMKYGIPTASYRTFTFEGVHDAIDYVQQHSLPVVIKADGLAAGKGVLICQSHEDAAREIESILRDRKFGAAGGKVVVEEFLTGIELSVFVLCNGSDYIVLPEAKDYKRIGEGETGLNTGGMGAVSPVPFADKAFMQKVEDRIIRPTVYGLVSEGIHYQGFIFVGLMKVGDDPYVIEYNCRLGDPETEAVLPRIKSDLVELFVACSESRLNKFEIVIDESAAATVMLVSEGYPGDYEKGKKITLSATRDSILFHAGTKTAEDGSLVTNGGRVMAVTSLAATIPEAVKASLATAANVTYEGKYNRGDIGFEFR